MLPSETMIWQPEFTDKTLSRKPGAVQSGILTESEKNALAYAISDECMEKHNWQTTQAGQVKDMEYNTEIFPRGFATGLRKLLGEVDD